MKSCLLNLSEGDFIDYYFNGLDRSYKGVFVRWFESKKCLVIKNPLSGSEVGRRIRDLTITRIIKKNKKCSLV